MTLNANGSQVPNDRCTEHNEELILYCIDDNELICSVCAGAVHSRHEIEALDVAQSKVQVQLQKQLTTLETKRSKLEDFIETVKKQSTDLKANSERAQKEAREKMDGLRKIIDEKEKEMLEAIQRMESTRNGTLQSEIHKAQSKIENIDKGVEMMTSAMSETTSLNFLRKIEDADEARYASFATDPEIKKNWFEMPPVITQHLEAVMKNLKYKEVKHHHYYGGLPPGGYPPLPDDAVEENYSDEEDY